MMELNITFTGFEQKLSRNGSLFYPKISTSRTPHCNTVLITLDASAGSLLDWREKIKEAQRLKEEGLLLLWQLDFALYEDSFLDEARFLSLELAVKHFTETVWPIFSEMSLGVVLHQGALDFSQNYPWTQEEKKECEQPWLYCQEIVLRHLKLLASHFPQECTCFLLLDTDCCEDAATYFRLTSQEAFFPFLLILKGKWPQQFPYAFAAIGWNHGSSPLGFFSDSDACPLPSNRVSWAICLPARIERLDDVIKILDTRPFRMIPEALLTKEWEGIDDLIVFSDGLSSLAKRKLLGFCAAGGSVHTVGEPIGLPEETPYMRAQFPL